jgi:putative glutamine amidotransferase
MRPKPIIGVPADRRVYEPHPFHMVGEKYLKAVIEAADAVPLIIPVLADDLAIDELVDQVDGVMLTGSPSDIEPHHYGGESDDPDALRDPHRDALTLPIARHALETGVPLFAICRGFQELNVVQYGPSHPVTLVEGGMLAHLAGTGEVMVNSLHGQGVARLADGVTVEAVADDGLIEAFTVDGAKSFALAVQWHPEWKATSNEFSTAIFKAFGDACRERAGKRRV